MTGSSGQNYYELLSVPRTASPAETKASYHRLLSLHPDKLDASGNHPTQTDVDIGRRKGAFVTLLSLESRTKYDSELSSPPDPSSRSRPAHIVSLEDEDFEDIGRVWTCECRCGGRYTVKEEDMETGVH